MLRNLIDEVRSRRVLAFAALGVLVALALPLLFLKSAPEGSPGVNTAAPAAAEEAKLPARAARLLATNDGDTIGGRASGSSQDPFSPPAAYRSAAAAATAAQGGGGSAAQGGGGSAPASSAAAKEAANAQAGGGSKGLEVTIKTPAATTPSTTSNNANATTSTGTTKRARSLSARNAVVDVRYGPKRDTKIRRAIRRQKAFYIHGKLVAVFVKYSPSRKAAVFALAPGLHVTSDVKCRVIKGSCRYVDLPAGSHAWLTMVTANRTIVSRRLDVVHIKRRAAGRKTRAISASARSEASCLARKLVAMERGDALLGRDACKN